MKFKSTMTFFFGFGIYTILFVRDDNVKNPIFIARR